MRGSEVVAVVQIEVEPTARQAGHRGQVKDPLRPIECTRRNSRRKVEVVEAKVRMIAGAGEVALLHASRIVIREAIDAGDGMAVGEQPFAKVRPDEPGRAGHHTTHAFPQW